MKIAYLDCASGISGDMFLGALVDAGADLAEIKRALKNIPVTGYKLLSSRTTRCGVSAAKVDVILRKKEHNQARRWQDVKRLIGASALEDSVKRKGLDIFRLLFEAEGKVHDRPFDKVHLHELGAVDCIVDIFGTLIGLKLLGVERVYSSAVNLGSGTVRTAHGLLPVPAPATLEILKGRPAYASNIPFELATPTGSVLLKALSETSESMPRMIISRIGYGAGNKDFQEMPNVLRLITGEADTAGQDLDLNDSVVVIETNIDDMNPQHYEAVMSKLLSAGALDVFLENIIMKKGRPAVKVTCITRESDLDKMSDILFADTTTIGIRYYRADRKILSREIKAVRTKYGIVRFKVSIRKGKVTTVTPEYEDLRAISEKRGISIKELTSALADYSVIRLK
ncbi:MAG TPA: nickel pincer cofactor biosynthesis protein LarC [Dissulfurispiraceae bacterium]|nr:nickel pincer cofactor biosynthesis protein LarC [Dissulfurispiraceae bacterium]